MKPLAGKILISEIAQAYGWHIETVRRHIKRGNLQATKIGKSYYADIEAFEDFRKKLNLPEVSFNE